MGLRSFFPLQVDQVTDSFANRLRLCRTTFRVFEVQEAVVLIEVEEPEVLVGIIVIELAKLRMVSPFDQNIQKAKSGGRFAKVRH